MNYLMSFKKIVHSPYHLSCCVKYSCSIIINEHYKSTVCVLRMPNRFLVYLVQWPVFSNSEILNGLALEGTLMICKLFFYLFFCMFVIWKNLLHIIGIYTICRLVWVRMRPVSSLVYIGILRESCLILLKVLP